MALHETETLGDRCRVGGQLFNYYGRNSRHVRTTIGFPSTVPNIEYLCLLHDSLVHLFSLRVSANFVFIRMVRDSTTNKL